MRMSSDMASIHGYLCSDGYVIRSQNPKYVYYYVGLRNLETVLLEDFKEKCSREFGVIPIIPKEKDRCKFQKKEICLSLLKRFGSLYSADWRLPDMTDKNVAVWIRSYFDCDGWVSAIRAKDRKVGLDSINHVGLLQIQNALRRFGIDSSVKKRKNRNIWTMSICGKDDLIKFQESINFLHPRKKSKLQEAIESYVDYRWKIPTEEKEFVRFLESRGKISTARREVRLNSIIRSNLMNSQAILMKMKISSRLNGPWKNPYGSKWYCLSINLRDFNKLRGGVK